MLPCFDDLFAFLLRRKYHLPHRNLNYRIVSSKWVEYMAAARREREERRNPIVASNLPPTVMSTHLPHDYALYITERAATEVQTLFLEQKKSQRTSHRERKRERKLGGMHDEQEVSWIICPRMRKCFAEGGYAQVTQPLSRRTYYWHSPFSLR